MRSKRFILDANVWISYFIVEKIETLTKVAHNNKLDIFYCAELLQEIERVLGYEHLEKYEIDKKEAIKAIQYIGRKFDLVYPIKKYVSDDNDDNYIIALALQTNSGFVTSGDKHILSEKDSLEKKYSKLKIITRLEFEHIVKWNEIES